VPFLAAVQTTADGKPVVACFAPRPLTRAPVAAFAARSLASTAQVVSDGLDCFGAVTQVGASHERVVTGEGVGSVKLPQFTAINTVLGNLKAALAGTYHAFAFAKYAHRNLAEVQYRFNRRFDLSVILARPLRAAAVTPPQPQSVIRMAEVCC
jgi:hypothetical protein